MAVTLVGDVGIAGDQPRRPVDLAYHRIAGVDTQAALYAAEARPFADVAASWADLDAIGAGLIAVGDG